MFDDTLFYKFLFARIMHSGLIEIRTYNTDQKFIFRLANFLHLIPLEVNNVTSGKNGEQDLKGLYIELKNRAEKSNFASWLNQIENDAKAIYKGNIKMDEDWLE